MSSTPRPTSAGVTPGVTSPEGPIPASTVPWMGGPRGRSSGAGCRKGCWARSPSPSPRAVRTWSTPPSEMRTVDCTDRRIGARPGNGSTTSAPPTGTAISTWIRPTRTRSGSWEPDSTGPSTAAGPSSTIGRPGTSTWTTTLSGSTRRTRTTCSWATTGDSTLPGTGPGPGASSTTFPSPSSTRSAWTTASRTTSTAGSRTTEPGGFRPGPTPGPVSSTRTW